jgi:hypothetical protein
LYNNPSIALLTVSQQKGNSKMKVYGRKLLDRRREQYEIEFDEIVFVADNREIIVSIYHAKTGARLEIRANDGILVVLPRAANMAEIESRR